MCIGCGRIYSSAELDYGTPGTEIVFERGEGEAPILPIHAVLQGQLLDLGRDLPGETPDQSPSHRSSLV